MCQDMGSQGYVLEEGGGANWARGFFREGVTPSPDGVTHFRWEVGPDENLNLI